MNSTYENDTSLKILICSADTHEDIYKQCAKLHADTITEGFLTSLGKPFLTQMYSFIATNTGTQLLVAVEADKVCGLLAMQYNSDGYMKRFARERFLKIAPILAVKAFSPTFLRKLFETVTYSANNGFESLPDAEILNFCVAPGQQGKGIGQKLMARMEKSATDQNIHAIRIVTGEKQESAHTFYERYGAKFHSQVSLHKDSLSRIYIYEL